ncbi:hypothetical protein [Pseudonocardia lacus]|nr:hypothetical protein [Pseudonocardia lacus]
MGATSAASCAGAHRPTAAISSAKKKRWEEFVVEVLDRALLA